jgi:tRNA (guanine-N7-)-methyltransferase
MKAASLGRKTISSPNLSGPFKAQGTPRRHWGRRKGPALSARQSGLLETLLPQLALHPESARDPKTYFEAPVRDVWLEVGFGAGEHLAWQAEANPDTGIIGAEPYVSGIAKLLTKLEAPSPSPRNIRLYSEDAHDIVAALPDASLGKVFILFPDPWPKTRHHKRRFIQMDLLSQLARVMREGAELRFATDDRGYLVWALERLTAHPAFAWMAQSCADWNMRPSDWPQTRYEAKALHGRPYFLRFQRVAG